jgi:hypothetical protein
MFSLTSLGRALGLTRSAEDTGREQRRIATEQATEKLIDQLRDEERHKRDGERRQHGAREIREAVMRYGVWFPGTSSRRSRFGGF